MGTEICSKRVLRKQEFETRSESDARSLLNDLRPFCNEAERRARVIVGKVLADGQPHSRAELVRAVRHGMLTVYLTRARAFHLIRHRIKHGNYNLEVQPTETDDMVGARWVVTKVIYDKCRKQQARKTGATGSNWSVQLIPANGGNRLVRETRAGGTPMAGQLVSQSPIPLVKYEAARKALEAATKIDEVKSIHAKAVAMAAYAKQAKDTDMINWAVEIKVRAERRAGELLKAMPKNVGGNPKLTSSKKEPLGQSKHEAPTLAAQGISKKESMTWQKLADIPAPVFEKKLIAVKAQGEKLTTKAVLAIKKPSSSAHKEEPDMGLDVIETIQKLVKRWPGEDATLIKMLLVAIGNLKKGTL